MKCFYPVSKEIFSFVTNKKARTLVSLFFGILAGGLLYHFVRYFEYFYKESLWEAAKFYFSAIFYYGAVASLIVFSVSFKKTNFFAFLGRSQVFIRPVCYLIIWSLVYTLHVAVLYSPISSEEYLKFILGLFNL